MEKESRITTYNSVTCPACSLLCDDLNVMSDAAGGSIKMLENGCSRSIKFFEHTLNSIEPRLEGQKTNLDNAISHATKLIKASNHTLISGLAVDVHGMRSILSLADKIGASLDHMNSSAMLRNTLVVQNSGWQVCTLTEVRNRVDLLLVIGTDIVSIYPRFFEKVVWIDEIMFDQDISNREIVYIGGKDLNTDSGMSKNGKKPTVISCENTDLPEVTNAIRALVQGKSVSSEKVGGIAVSDLKQLAERLIASKYSVITWATSTFDFPHAELTVQNITETINFLNRKTRCSGLPLAGNEGDVTANQVSTWISGYPIRNSFIHGYPEYSPYQFNTPELLSNGEADILIWVNTLNPDRLPPSCDIPTIVFGHPDMKFNKEPDLFIPVGVPGIDHTGTMFRCDNVVSLQLKKIRESKLPTLQSVVSSIESSL